MAKPAQALTRAVRDWLTLHGWFVWKGGTGAIRKQSGGFASFGTAGAPDLYAARERITQMLLHASAGICAPAKLMCDFVCIEIKAGKDQQNENQKHFQREIESHGGRYIIVRSLDDLKGMER